MRHPLPPAHPQRGFSAPPSGGPAALRVSRGAQSNSVVFYESGRLFILGKQQQMLEHRSARRSSRVRGPPRGLLSGALPLAPGLPGGAGQSAGIPPRRVLRVALSGRPVA